MRQQIDLRFAHIIEPGHVLQVDAIGIRQFGAFLQLLNTEQVLRPQAFVHFQNCGNIMRRNSRLRSASWEPSRRFGTEDTAAAPFGRRCEPFQIVIDALEPDVTAMDDIEAMSRGLTGVA